MVYRQLLSELFTQLMHIFPEECAILFGEVDVLEDAMGRRNSAGLYEKPAGKPVFIEADDFAWFDFTDKFCAYCIDSTRFAGDDVVTFFGLADTQRPDAVRISCRFNAVRKEK